MPTLKKEDSTYLPVESSQDRERLIVQAQSFDGLTRLFLSELNLPTGETTLVAGFGAGNEIPIHLKHSAAVIGVEIDQLKAQAAQEQHNNNDNIKILQASIVDLKEIPTDSIKKYFSRIVLQHLTPEARTQAMQEAIRIVKPGGIIAAEDLTVGTWDMYPRIPAFEDLKQAFLETYKVRNTEPSMGSLLPQLWKDFGLKNIVSQTRTIVSRGADPFMHAYPGIMMAAKPGIIDANIMSEQKFDQALSEAKQAWFDGDTMVICPVVTQIAGQVPA